METENFEVLEEEQQPYSNDDLYNISSWGADLTFRELIQMYDEGDLIKPELQRKYVWTKDEASRFIDSILLGLPVPSIFLAVDDDERRLIVDGYQRIMSARDYVRGVFTSDEKLFRLSDKEIINSRWRGKSFEELEAEEKRRIRTTTIHAIIFEQKYPNNDTGMYQIFERINTSGKTLKPQEIRNCVYQGSFNELLFELNRLSVWRTIVGSEKEDPRMYDMELILRFFAICDIKNSDEFQEKQINLTKFLNVYMGKNKNLNDDSSTALKNRFLCVMTIARELFGQSVFRRYNEKTSKFAKSIHPITFEAISVSIYFAHKEGYDFNSIDNYSERYHELLQNDAFIDATSVRTTNVENIKQRIKIALKILFGMEYDWGN
ncbi:hypothetical protein M2475_000819 [Breznakia sp. PF5-3]|uniref:DUF262 domain-containing protein n=1 Tax=unclassified Breznakia TaxID=2623764 RepID=UPI0024049C4F|nr:MULTISPECIES: DUF262 domain-containing protein [unclassified Breznakia]MDF9824463.1 hypothetical protein [Breznakia sp. PM6-1]MDF9835254.1 hypothetical protein [Breznakia sp. PF5-3]MDF9837418.1 hypothetical protein [Breznakia sp. PFB2-8]MDF9859354.1 hypothetical protein [Breznakia sp. PH5-24]